MSGVGEAALILGLISSIINIVDAAHEVYEGAHDAKGLPKKLKVAAEQLPLLLYSLNLAHDNLETGKVSNDAIKSAIPVLESCKKSAESVQAIFDKNMPSEKDSTGERYKKPLNLKRKTSEVVESIQNIAKNMELLAQYQIFQDAQTLEEIKDAVGKLEADDESGHVQSTYGSGDIVNQSGLGTINKKTFNTAGASTVYSAETMHFGGKDPKVGISFFKTSNYESFKNDLNIPRVKDTCEWFLTHPQFRSWKQNSENDILWLSADPGCGKSVLSRALIDEKLVGGSSTLILYFFFKDNAEQSAASVAICALLHQLFRHRPSLFAQDAVPVILKEGLALKSDFETLWKLLMDVMSSRKVGDAVCILDALDECQDTDRPKLIHKLEQFYYARKDRRSRVANNYSTKFLVTSRPYQNIHLAFDELTSRFPAIRLAGEEESEAISQEIKLVIKNEIDRIGRSFMRKNEHQEKALQILLGMENRTYLWLKFAFDEIRRQAPATATELLAVTERLPSSIEAAYENILSRCDNRGKVSKILQIILAAQRPLTLEEIDVALGIDGTTTSYRELQSELAGPESRKEQIRSQCGLFVSIVHSRLYLIHQTAREFLLLQNEAQRPLGGSWKHSIFLSESHMTLAVICVYCLRLSEIKEEMEEHMFVSKGYELSSYAGEHWATHFTASEVNEEHEITSLATTLYMTPSILLFWMRLYCRSASNGRLMSRFFRLGGTSKEPLQVVSLIGHDGILRKLQFTPEMSSELDKSLYWAALMGHIATVRVLLDKGADVTAQQGKAVGAAAREGYTELVDMFLKLIDNSVIRCAISSNALQEAAHRGRIETMNFLIDCGAYVNANGGDSGSSLQAACGLGHIEAVRLLLDQGAEINAQGGRSGNALQSAVESRIYHLVEMLIARGADVNAQGGEFGNALQTAAKNNDTRIVELLLSHNADVNAQGGKFGNAVQAASRAKFHANDKQTMILELLLASGADVNAEGGVFGTALQAAAAVTEERLPTIDYLIAQGAKVNVVGGMFGTALQAAAAGNHTEMVETLLRANADPNAKGGVYGNPLQAAAISDRTGETLKMLLDSGADINANEGKYGTALQAAAAHGTTPSLQLLLERGADVNVMGGEHNSALQAALVLGRKTIAEILMNHGAVFDPDRPGGDKAVQQVLIRGHVRALRWLVDHGVEIKPESYVSEIETESRAIKASLALLAYMRRRPTAQEDLAVRANPPRKFFEFVTRYKSMRHKRRIGTSDSRH